MKTKLQRPILLSNKAPKDIVDEVDYLISQGNHIDSMTVLASVSVTDVTYSTVIIIVSIEVDVVEEVVDDNVVTPKEQSIANGIEETPLASQTE